MAVVAGGAEIGDALGGDGVDRLGDEAVLEERLVEIADVVDDDLGLGRVGQGLDVVGEAELAAVGGGECQAGAGSDVVDVLQHRPAFVGAARRAVREHVDRLGLVGRSPVLVDSASPPLELIHAVGEHADGDAGAVDAELLAGHVGEQSRFPPRCSPFPGSWCGLVDGWPLIVWGDSATVGSWLIGIQPSASPY